MNQFIEIEDRHFNKILVNVNRIVSVSEKGSIYSEIRIEGIAEPFDCKYSYREIKKLLGKVIE